MESEKRGADPLLDRLCLEVYKRRVQARGYRKQGNDEYTRIYNQGLQDEERVVEFLRSQGHEVETTDLATGQLEDIDFYLDGVPVSMKAEHDGHAYSNIYFELATQRDMGYDWEEEALAWVQRLGLASNRPISVTRDTWQPGWYLFGQAQQYLIWQGDRLMLFEAVDIKDHIVSEGFELWNGRQKVLGLSPRVLAGQGYKNTVCGYLATDAVSPLREWHLDCDRKLKRRNNKYRDVS